MRQTWKEKVQWDEELSKEIKDSWLKLTKDLEALKDISFQRFVFEEQKTDLKINVFCDASKSAYSFAVYVSSSTESYLLMAKSKVAPLVNRTLPSLELLSIFLALKCLPQVLDQFETSFQQINVFSDSQIALAWIASKITKVKQLFVRNRIQDIKLMVSSLHEKFKIQPVFHYVRSEENPSDLITRGLSFKEFKSKLQFWEHGPEWLLFAEVYWPKHPSVQGATGADQQASYSVLQNTPNFHSPVINFSRFSNLQKLYRVLGIVFKFLSKNKADTSAHDLAARRFCLKTMQMEDFALEMRFLEETPKTSPIPKLVNNLNLFLDENGLIRSRGRLSRCNYYQYEVINPLLLSKKHHFTRLVIIDAHNRCKHLGIQATLTNIRLQGFWITSARNTIRKVLSECAVCNRYNYFAFSYPKFTNFTKAQMNLVRPFQRVGVDYTKHYYIRDPLTGTSAKFYILIYTCLNVRGIYLDLIPDMSAKVFIQSFQRFSNRFGLCDYLYSDNARSFVQAGDLLENIFVSDEGKEFFRLNQIKHIRIPLYSPWMGALWERQIKTVKDCLNKTMGRAQLGYFDFLTLLSSIENAINSRPLTYMSSDNDVVPLTPNAFLRLHSNPSLILRQEDKEDPMWSPGVPNPREILLDSLTSLSDRFEYFRTRWYEEYLLSLRELSKDLYQTSWSNRIRVGDVVLIKAPVKARPFWQMGVVSRLVEGDDGKVRTVFLRTAGGQISQYPIKLLYPLELSITHEGSRREIPTPPSLPNSNFDPTLTSTPVASDPVLAPPAAVSLGDAQQSRPQRPVRATAKAAKKVWLPLCKGGSFA